MAQKEGRSFKARLQFAGLEPDAERPTLAAYEIDATGRPVRKLRRAEKDHLEVDDAWSKLGIIALGPDVDDVAELRKESLIPYRLENTLPIWRDQGLTIGRDLWERFFFEIVCVSGEASKCRPWWWTLIEQIDTFAGLELSRSIPNRAPTETLIPRPLFPMFCLPLCDGIVEVYERVCCCRRWYIPDILDRIREILKVIPIPLPDPPVPPIGPLPGPGPDPAPILANRFNQPATAGGAFLSRSFGSNFGGALRSRFSELRQRMSEAPLPTADMPSERLYADYLALSTMDRAEAERYVLARPYLIGLICTCSQRKVGETPLQPGGRFDFCYKRPRNLFILGVTCHTSFAFKVRQFIQGSWVTVYDGVASHDWFAQGESADLHSWDWRALVCGSGPGDPPPTDGALPFVMLEYVGSAGTRHRKFPAQIAHTQVAALTADSGTYDTGYAQDCPWGKSLGLRLWFSPDLQPIAKYYRLSVVAVTNGGAATGSVTILDAPVSWDRWIQVGGNWVTTSELLSANPADVGGQQGLIRIPYWSGGNFWLSSQLHQVWNTTLYAHGKYMLRIELFDAAAARIKPNSAPPGDPGTAQTFQFRRWRISDATATDNVPFADAAHVFWLDNGHVQGDIVDFRKDGAPSGEECQFISGPPETNISVGFRAYHPRGVADPGNTFMMNYSVTWTRGLNGPSGSFANGTADVGEPPNPPAASNNVSIGALLGPWPGFPTSHARCTFSVHLAVHAKHFTGSGRILEYDYHENASFAASTP